MITGMYYGLKAVLFFVKSDSGRYVWRSIWSRFRRGVAVF